MKLKPIGSNMTEVTLGDKCVLFSYSTPVAYNQSGVGYYLASKKWSVTTSRHINKLLAGATATEVDQVMLDIVGVQIDGQTTDNKSMIELLKAGGGKS